MSGLVQAVAVLVVTGTSLVLHTTSHRYYTGPVWLVGLQRHIQIKPDFPDTDTRNMNTLSQYFVFYTPTFY